MQDWPSDEKPHLHNVNLQQHCRPHLPERNLGENTLAKKWAV